MWLDRYSLLKWKATSHTDICMSQVQLLGHFWPFIIAKNMRKNRKLKGDMMLCNEAGVIKYANLKLIDVSQISKWSNVQLSC